MLNLRRLALAAAVLTSLCTPWSRGDDAAELRPLIERGVESLGGKDKLTKLQAIGSKISGMYYGMGAGIPFNGSTATQQPDRLRVEVAGVYLIVVNGKNGWVQVNGAVNDLNAEQLEDIRNDFHFDRVMLLVALGDKGIRLTKTGETQVLGKSAVGVRVERENYRNVEIFLDADSGLVVKRAAQVRSTELGGQLVQEEIVYSDFQTVDGLKIPTKSVSHRNGEKYVEIEHADLRVAEKFDDAEFQRP